MVDISVRFVNHADMSDTQTTRDSRVPVMLTSIERSEIKKAADREGVAVSTYLRIMALRAARDV